MIAERSERQRPCKGALAVAIRPENTVGVDACGAFCLAIQINAAYQANFGLVLTHEDAAREEGVGACPQRRLRISIWTMGCMTGVAVCAPQYPQLIGREFSQDNGRVRRHEYLPCGIALFGAEYVQQSRDSIGLKPVLDFIDQRNLTLAARAALHAGDQQATRAEAEVSERDAVLVVHRDGAAGEGEALNVQQRLNLTDINADFTANLTDDAERRLHFLVGFAFEGISCQAAGGCQRGGGSARSFDNLRPSADPRRSAAHVCAETGGGVSRAMGPGEIAVCSLSCSAIGDQAPCGLKASATCSRTQPRPFRHYPSNACQVIPPLKPLGDRV